jgi:hypothetical protein
MDLSLSILMPDADIRGMLTKYYRKRNRRLRRQFIRESSIPTHALRQAIELPRLAYEQTMYRGTVVRRLAMIFEGTTSSVVQFSARIFNAVSTVFAVAGAVLFLVVLHQLKSSWIPPVIRGPVADVFASVPRLDVQVWVVVLAIVIYGWRSFRTLARRFREREAQLPGT